LTAAWGGALICKLARLCQTCLKLSAPPHAAVKCLLLDTEGEYTYVRYWGAFQTGRSCQKQPGKFWADNSHSVM